MFEPHIAGDSELCWNVESVRERDVMAGKTAPASLMQFSSTRMNGSCTGPDCLGMFGLDRNVGLIKPYRSAPNIDLLCHAKAGRATPPNEPEEILKPVSIVEQRGKSSIPKIVVVCESDEDVSMVETCAQSQEPDIVQSTKSGSLPRQDMMQQPIAPPRKKRFKTPSPLSADNAEEVCLSYLLNNWIL